VKVRIHAWLLLGTLSLAGVFPGQAGNWPQWRGPNFNGSCSETNLPAKLSVQNDLAWKQGLPGRSGATPVVWGDSLFLPTPDADKNVNLLCVDLRTGQARWQRQVGVGDRTAGKNNMASPSAATDGRGVYILSGAGDLVAFDFEGKELWRRRLTDEFGLFANLFLYGASPLFWEGKLYISLLQRNPPTYGHAQDRKPERRSCLICIDPATGKILWSRDRKTTAREEAMEAYTTPTPYLGANGFEIILVGADCVTGHRPDTGEELWRYAGLNRQKNPGGRIVPSAVTASGLVFACGPKREQLVALRPSARGTMDEDGVAWKTTQNIPDVPTPLSYQGKLFVLDGDRQIINTYAPDTGERLAQCRLGIREIFYASPTGADGKIYCLSEDGTLVVLSAGPELKVLSTTALGEGPCMSSVVIVNQQFLIRTSKNLYCLRARN
jgi:outer membrane protein assembly factor BamB